jgi:hypothetical protein
MSAHTRRFTPTICDCAMGAHVEMVPDPDGAYVLAAEAAAPPELVDALRALVADVEAGSLIYEYGDKRETQRDVQAARAILARIEGGE